MTTNQPPEIPAEQPPAASQTAGEQQPEEEQPAPLPEPKAVTRKDIPLKDFLAKMDDYAPIVHITPPVITLQQHNCMLKYPRS